MRSRPARRPTCSWSLACATPAPTESLPSPPSRWPPSPTPRPAAAGAACPGFDANPGDPQSPRLAGMPERYIAEQLALFKANQRTSGMAAVMIPFATMLSPQDMRDVGAYFAQQNPGAGIAD